MKGMDMIWQGARPFLAVILLQFANAGMSIIAKFALNQGMSPHVLVVYRHAIATFVISPLAFFFDRKARPKMTRSVFIKIVLLGLLEPTIDQNLLYSGMKCTSAAFASAMTNVLPAFAFLMAWVFRLEKVELRRVHSQAKILGTILTVGGAMMMTLVKGPILDLPWTHTNVNNINLPQQSPTSVANQDPIKGGLFIIIGCISWAAFFILQAVTLKVYPAELSLTAWICLMGTAEGTIAAIIIERGNSSVWSIHLDAKLLTAAYAGIILSGIGYYVQGLIMRTKGPVFVTSFSPISMVVVTIIGSFILQEIIYLGRVIGAVVIIAGLYTVLWGKSKDQLQDATDLHNEKSSFPDNYNHSNSNNNNYNKNNRGDEEMCDGN